MFIPVSATTFNFPVLAQIAGRDIRELADKVAKPGNLAHVAVSLHAVVGTNQFLTSLDAILDTDILSKINFGGIISLPNPNDNTYLLSRCEDFQICYDEDKGFILLQGPISRWLELLDDLRKNDPGPQLSELQRKIRTCLMLQGIPCL